MTAHVNDIGGIGALTDPKITGSCEWCDDAAVGAFPLVKRMPGKRNQIVRTGQHVFYCNRHQGTAERFVAEPL